MRHFLQDDVYNIVDDEGKIIFSVTLVPDLPNNQVVIRTKKEVYAGPIDFIAFKEEPLNIEVKE